MLPARDSAGASVSNSDIVSTLGNSSNLIQGYLGLLSAKGLVVSRSDVDGSYLSSGWARERLHLILREAKVIPE